MIEIHFIRDDDVVDNDRAVPLRIAALMLAAALAHHAGKHCHSSNSIMGSMAVPPSF